MRPIFLFACLFALAAKGQTGFLKHFGGSKFDRALYLRQTSDKGYMACGYSNSFSGNHDLYLAKLNQQGDLQWEQHYGGSKMDLGWSVLELKDGWMLHGCTMSKDTSNQDTSNQDIYLLRLDQAGKIIWEKTYGSKKDERTTDLLVLSDGNYLLIGERILQDSVNRDSYILKLDTAGTVIWERTFGGPRVERTYYGAETPNGNYLISGSIFPYDNAKADLLFLEVSKDGKLNWTKTIGEKEVHEVSHSFRRNRDEKTYTVNGYISSGIPSIHDALFMQIDEHGSELRRQVYSTGNDLRIMHAEETSDKGFVATGYTRIDPSKNIWDAVLLRYDIKGNVQWMKTFGTPEKDDQGYWIICNEDGGYTFAGYSNSYGTGGDLWVIRTDGKGEVRPQ